MIYKKRQEKVETKNTKKKKKKLNAEKRKSYKIRKN